MKRITAALLSVAAIGVTATVAGAAAAPTVTTGKAAAVKQLTAVVNGTVNPNGNPTTYDFEYGPTTSLGAVSPARSAGAGTSAVAVHAGLTGLTPGTTYYYRLAAISAAGSSDGAIQHFTTKGHPPALAVTGPAVNVTQTSAETTGSIDPEGVATTWQIQYGLTTAYGLQTAPVALPAASAPVPVSAVLAALAPGMLFHYRVIAYHADNIVSAGADQTFFTYPRFRRKPRMHTRTRPGTATASPYVFTTSGSLRNAALFVPAPLRCTGVVTVSYYKGHRRVAFALTDIASPTCTFSVPVTFRHLIGSGATPLTVRVHYRGNGYLTPVTKTDHVTLG